jgi:hypothetical protein
MLRLLTLRPGRPEARGAAMGDLGKRGHLAVFPNEKGRIESHGNAIPRAWQGLQLAAGVAVLELDEKRKPVISERWITGTARPARSPAFFRQLVRCTATGRRVGLTTQEGATSSYPISNLPTPPCP